MKNAVLSQHCTQPSHFRLRRCEVASPRHGRFPLISSHFLSMATVCCSHALLSQVESSIEARCQASASSSSPSAFASRKTVAARSLKTRSLQTSFVGGCSVKTAAVPSGLAATACTRRSVLTVTAESGASIEFIRGVKEVVVPEVRLTRARDGSSGTATFTFEQPSVFDLSSELGDITGLYMIDNEGVIQCVDVSAKFMNGRPAAIEARYIMRSESEWDRFMRFMERYAEANGLGFVKK